MRPIEFSRYVNSQAAATQSSGRVFGVRSSRKKVSTQSDKDFRFFAVHCLDRMNGVEPVCSRRFKTEFLTQLIQKVCGGLLPDAHGPIALHVAVPAHRTQTRARLSQLPTQHRQVDDLLNVRHA